MPLLDSVREKEKKKNSTVASPQKVSTQKPVQTQTVSKAPNATRMTGSYKTRNGISTQKVNTGFKPVRRFAEGSVQKRNYETIPQSQWNAAQWAAYGRVTGNNNVFDMLSTRTSTRGDSMWMPTLGGQEVVPDEWKQLGAQLGYDGPFDQKFADDLNAMYGSDVRFSKALGVSTPTKKSSPEEWYGWLATQVADNLAENNKLNEQNDEYRKAYSDQFNQFKKVNGRVPTPEEALALVDKTKYSKLTSLDDAYKYGTKIPILPVGTYYYPDCEMGWYQAKVNGVDITADNDYFDYHVQYYTNPVQETPSVKKYEWSGTDLNSISPEDQTKYKNYLLASGKREEAAAYDFACWAAQPHADGISAEPDVLDSVLGYLHDEEWVNKGKELLGDDYTARLGPNGEFIGNKGSKADYMDKACYKLYQVEQLIDATVAVKNEYEAYVKATQDVFNANYERYGVEDFDKFQRDVEYNVDIDDYPNLKKYMKDGFDPDKYSYNLYIDENTFGTIEKRIWDNKEVDTNKVYTAQVDPEFEASFGDDTPSEPPLFYAQTQLKRAAQRIADRNNAEDAVTQAVVSMAESGAPVSKGAVPVSNNIFDRMLDFGDATLGYLGKLWTDVFGDKHEEKLGVNYTPAEAAAADPVLAQLDVKNMPEALTTEDIAKIVNAKVMSRVHDDDICLADGIINYALPGAKHLHNILMDRTGGVANFNALTYRNVYNDRVDAGLDEEYAARVAAYAATEVNGAVESLGIRFEGDNDLTNAAKRLLDDMAAEEGALDSYDLFMAISDDVRDRVEAIGGAGEEADSIMQRLLPGLLVGSSDAATPGFRAETNQLTNDIANGMITADDIVMAMNPPQEVWEVDFSKRQYDGFTTTEAAYAELRENGGDFSTLFNVNGVMYTRGEYSNLLGQAKTLLGNAGGFLGSDRAFDVMSDDLKEAIGYDAIVATCKALYSPDEAQYYIDSEIRDAVDQFANPQKGWNTSYLLHGITDLTGELNSITSGKTEEDIARNLESNGMRGIEGWIEQNIIKADVTGFARSTIDFFNVLGRLSVMGALPEDSGILKQSAYGDMVDMMRAYGKFLSPNEADALWNAFANGTATTDEIRGLINQRTNAISNQEVNAINNPQAMEESYTGLDAGLEAARNYKPPTKIEDPELAGIYAPTNLGTDDQETAALVDKMISPGAKEAEVKQAFSPEELGVMEDFLGAYKRVGTAGFTLAMCDAQNLKTFLGIDLNGTRFKNGADILNNIDPNWSKPYGLNPGYEFGMLEAVGRGMGEGYESVYKVGALANSFLHYVGNALVGQGYDPMSDNTFGYRDFARTDEYNAAMQQNVGTKGQVFVEHGTAEVVRNAVTSSFGAMFGEAVAFELGARMTGIPQTIASLANVGEALTVATTFASRMPFASNVFFSEFDKQMKDGKSVWHAALRAGIDAGIEVFTESAPFEKFSSLSVGGFTIGEHAMNAASKMGGSKAAWLMQFAQNIFSEVKEEEASEFLGRLVDYGFGVIEGKSSEDSWAEAWEGYGQAAKDTAVATAFTTVLFGAMDLGGSLSDYVDQRFFNGQSIDFDELQVRMLADMILSKDVPEPEDIAQAERDAALGTSTYQKVKRQNEQRFAQQTQETTSEYNPATQVPTFGKKVQETEAKLAEVVKESVQQEVQQQKTSDGRVTKGMLDELHAETEKAAAVHQEKHTQESYDDYMDAIIEENAFNDIYDEQQKSAEKTPDGQVTPEMLDELHAATEEALDTHNKVQSEQSYDDFIMANEEEKAFNDIYDEQQKVSSKISEAAVNMMNAIAEERAEEAQKAQEAASEQTEENPQEEPQEAEQAAPELPEGAQKVKDYIDHSEDAIDNAIIEKGAQAEADKAVEEDPGIQAARDSIDKIKSNIQGVQEKIGQLQQQSQTIQGQLQQALAAVVDEGFDLNSPQAVNVQFQKTQERAAVEADIAQQTEKIDDLTRQVDEAQKQLDEKITKVAEDAKEAAATDLTKKVKDYRQSMADDAERELNAIRAKQGGYDVKSMATTKEDKAQRASISNEENDRLFHYAIQSRNGGGSETVEEYTDPANYRRKAPFVERRSEEWQDAAKQRQDYLTSAEGVQEEQQQRLLQDFDKWREANAPVEYIPVPQWAYEKINERAAAEARFGKGSERFTKKASRTGDSAKVYAQRRYKQGQEGGKWTTEDDLGYSENPEDVGIYSAADFLNDDGTVTGLAYRAITAADPSFVDNAGTLKVNARSGGVDASLEHFSENNRYLILATPKQQHEYGKASIDEDRYAMLTQKDPDLGMTGLDILKGNVEREKKKTDKYLADIRVTNGEHQALQEKLKDPLDYNPTETAQKFKDADEKLHRLYRGFYAQQKRQAEAEEKLNHEETFLAFYTGNKNLGGRTFYVIDKAAVETAESPTDLYQQAIVNASARISESADLSDEGIISLLVDDHEKAIAGLTDEKPSEVVKDATGWYYEKMSHEELGAALFDHFLQQELQKLYANKYNGAVQVLRDTDESTAEQKAKTFIDYNGGMSRDSFGGAGFAEFSRPDYYDTHTAYLATEEGVLKYLSDEDLEKLKINTTKAKYNAGIRNYAKKFAAENNLADSDSDLIVDTYGVKSRAPKTVGTATIVSSNNALFFGVPTKNVDDYTKNAYIRDKSGNYSIDLALTRLKDKMKQMVQTSEEQDHGVSNKKLDTGRDSIEVWFTDETGKSKKAKVGLYYNWWNRGSKFFPGFEELLGMADKIVCNFPVKVGKNNKGTFVSFTIVPKTEQTVDLEREMGSVSLKDVDGELAYLRGTKTTAEELRMVEEEIGGITDDDKLSTEAKLKYANAKFNDLKAQLKEALDNAETAAPDKQGYWTDRADSLRIEVNAWGERIRSIEDSTGNRAIVETKEAVDRYQKNNPKEQKYVIPKTARGRYEKAKARYDALTDPDGPFFDDERYDHERAMFADVLPTLKQYADEEDAQNQQEQPKAVTPDPITKKVAEAITSDEAKLDVKAFAETAPEKSSPVVSDAVEGVDYYMESKDDVPGAQADVPVPTTEKGARYLGENRYYDPENGGWVSLDTAQKAEPITSFRGDNAFLSNFYEAPVEVDGITYRNAEAAFQAQKLENAEERQQFANLTGKAAKQLGRKVQPRADWNTYRNEAMQKVIEAKFSQNPELMEKLKATGNADLVEGNTWNDTYWGVSNGNGENNLGKILMGVRDKTTTIAPEAKLAVLKGLSDDGANVKDIRSKAIADYHQDKMQDMSNEEKTDYLYGLARQQKTNPDGYTIDPTVNYDKKLGEELQRQDDKAKSKEAKRIKAIGRTTYKTVNGVNNALKELDGFEKNGHDVAAERERLNKNLEAIQNPNQQKIDEVVELADDPETKMNLTLFGQSTAQEALANAHESMESIANGILEAMGAPRQIVTGFEDTVSALKTADTTVANEEQLKEYENTVADSEVAIRSHREQIKELDKNVDALRKRRQEIEKQLDSMRKQYLTPDNYEYANRLYADKDKVFQSETGDIPTGREARHSYEVEIDQVLGDPNNSWTTEVMDEYNRLYAEHNNLGKRMATKIQDRNKLIQERDSIIRNVKPYQNALLNSKTAEAAVNNLAVFGPGATITNGDDQLQKIHSQKRQMYIEVAKRLVELGSPYTIHGRSTMITDTQMGDIFSQLFDEQQIKDRKAIADSLNRQVKQMKFDMAEIDLLKTVAAGDKEGYDLAFDKAMQAVMELYPQTDFTSAGRAAYERLKDKMRGLINDCVNKIKEQYNIGNDGDALYKVLDQQKLVYESAIERAQNVAKWYYGVGANDIHDSFNGKNGGHMLADVYQTFYALLRQSTKKLNPISFGTNIVDTFPRLVEEVMGDNAKFFISTFIEPVRVAEAKIAKRSKELRGMYKWMLKYDTETRDAIFRAAHFGWNEAYIRSEYKDNADVILRGVETCRKVLDPLLPEVNVAYGRNGIPAVKKREHYIPLIPEDNNKLMKFLGVHAAFDEIPTKDFGKTGDYTPIHEFFRFGYERKGEYLDGYVTDPVLALDAYVRSALTQIYQTDNIVRMRDMIDCIRENGDYADTGKVVKGGLENFAVAFENYCDAVSGKKVGHIDRFFEEKLGRKYFAWAQALDSIIGQSATAVNMNVVAANFEPLCMCIGSNPVQTAKALHDTISGMHDGTSQSFVDRSDFLTTRFAERGRANNWYQKMVQGMYKPAEWTDRFVAEAVVRTGYYNACSRLGINPDGDSELHRQAMKNADNFAIKVMASKGRGEKLQAQNSTAGAMFTKFLQENINNFEYMAKDAKMYAGGNKDTATNNMRTMSGWHGMIKALVAILMAMGGHELINHVTGRESLPSAYGAVRKAVNNREEGESVFKTGWESLVNLIHMNPFDDRLNSNSKWPLGNVPVVSSVEQTYNYLVSAAQHAYNAANNKITGKEYYPYETDFYSDLLGILFKWAPGGTAAKRIYDTTKIATQGYSISKNGKMKYAYNPTPGNIALSVLFGPDSSVEGRKYTASGYKTQGEDNTKLILDMIAGGISSIDAYNSVVNKKESSSLNSAVSEAERVGDFDTIDSLGEEARSVREKQGIPTNLHPDLYGSVEEPWLQKGIEMWVESGKTTYPTKFAPENSETYGMYFKFDNKAYAVDEETLKEMDAEFFRNAAGIINDGGNPEDVAKSLEDRKKKIREWYIKNRLKRIGGE